MQAPAKRRWYRTPDVRWLLAIFLIAFALRLLTVAVIHPDPRDGRFDDSVWYDTSAKHLAAGDGYVFDPTVWLTADGTRVYPDESQLTPTALWPPGYPVTLAAIYYITGDSLWAGRMFNVLCGALTALLVYAIARKLFGLTEAVVAGLLMALFPGHIYFTPLLMSETYFLLLMTATIAVFLYFVLGRERPQLLGVAAAGVLAGMTGMSRGEFAPFAGIMLLLMLLHLGLRRSLLPAAVLLLGMGALVVPWTIRNERTMGAFIPGTTGAGVVALQGHHPLSEGIPSLDIFGRIEHEYASLGRTEREVKVNSEGLYRARTYAWDHKLNELRLLPRRMFGLFRSDESAITWSQSNKPVYGEETAKRLINLNTWIFYGTVGFALLSWPLWWRTRDTKRLLVFAPVPFYMLMFGVIFIGDPRYHFGMYTTLVVFASTGITMVLRMTREQWREAMGGRSIGRLLRTYGTPSP
ncbi:MAG: glycosyltransferase family 39 protein [Chloroflexota bacterium]|nr:glycosyltransferase family 39 protein [Chloroflexota bacterium]